MERFDYIGLASTVQCRSIIADQLKRLAKNGSEFCETLLQVEPDEKDFCRFCVIVPSGRFCNSHSQGLLDYIQYNKN
jgi:hypothetical protein